MESASRTQRRDAAFRHFVELAEAGSSPDSAAFLENVPGDVRADVGEMIAEFLEIASTTGQRPELAAGLAVDDFELVEHAGTGGAGTVWRATQVSIDRFVALKFLRPELVASPVAVERFRREAQAAGRLAHRGIVNVFGDGIWQGLPYIVLEFVEGQGTLVDWIESHRPLGKLPSEHYHRVASLFRRVADGLVHAHARGVVHRDVKPANILIDADGRPLVADFGTALIEEQLHLTRTGDFFGTPFYMSPEQAASRRMGIDHRTDVFSLGATLYEALSLTRAFDGDTSMQVFTKILTVDPPDPRTLRSQVPRDLAVICMKALEKNPEGRYASMKAFRDDLAAFMDGRDIQARPPSLMQRVHRRARRHPRAMAAAAMAAVLALPIAVMWNGKSEALAASRHAEQRSEAIADRLAISAAANVLVDRMDELWPLSPERASAMEEWAQSATELSGTLAPLSADVADFQRGLGIREISNNIARNQTVRRAVASLLDPTESAIGVDLIRLEFERNQRTVEGLSTLDGVHRGGLTKGVGPGIDRRLGIIYSAERLSLKEPEALTAWAESATAVTADTRFEGFVLEPIYGLVPLGVDAQSGLLEFADATTGQVPVRDSRTGRLKMTSDCGLVFVLIPGGTHWIGAQSTDTDTSRYDPDFEREDDLARVEVNLDPFLISKYEMHQMAFMRLAGFDPSVRKHPTGPPRPVETIPYDLLIQYLPRADLNLPTQAQWEVAARGGTDYRWFFLADNSADDLCNVAGIEADEAGMSWRERPDDWRQVDDGFVRTAPIDTMRPNPYGLHHVHGNVNEICSDEYGKPEDGAQKPRIGDGLIQPSGSDEPRVGPVRHVYKGGSFHNSVNECRVIHLQWGSSGFADNGNGVRPVHPIPYLPVR